MSSSLLNYQNEQSSTSNDDTMPIISDVQSIKLSKSKRRSRPSRTSLIIYGPICIRKRHIAPTTLATGRRSKDTIIQGEDIKKRELRRLKNRESARNLKKLRDNIQDDLKNQVNRLQSEEENLLKEVENLKLYKQHLEGRCQQISPTYEIIARTTSEILLGIKKQQNSIEPKQEPHIPSSPWQLLFHI